MAEDGVVALAGVTLAASLFGSAHCAGMCGGIAAIAAGEERGTRLARSIGYHAGRLASYAAVGALAGAAGAVVDDAGALVGLQRFAAVSAGLAIAAFGAAAVLRGLGVRPRSGLGSRFGLGLGLQAGSAAAPPLLVRVAQRVHARSLRLPARWRGLPLGLAAPLLPCGWMYAFAAIAAAGGSATVGVVVMAAFWAGTVPALAAVAGGARLVLARLGRAAPVAMGIAMCVVGLHVVFSRASLAGEILEHAARRANAVRAAHVADAGDAMDADHGGSDPASAWSPEAGGLREAVGEAATDLPPCCRSRP